MTIFETPYGTVDAPSLEAAQKWLQKQGVDKPAPSQPSASSEGPGAAEGLWSGLQNFASGVGRGLAGQGVPAGKASEDPGGRSEFGGRMVGAGARSIGEGLWEAIKAPGQVATGEKQPTVENALPTAMLMAGQGGVRRPMVTGEVRRQHASGSRSGYGGSRHAAASAVIDRVRSRDGLDRSNINCQKTPPSAGEGFSRRRQQPPTLDRACIDPAAAANAGSRIRKGRRTSATRRPQIIAARTGRSIAHWAGTRAIGHSRSATTYGCRSNLAARRRHREE